MKPLILASQSPRRRAILSQFKIPFISVSPTFDEDAVTPFPDPVKFAHHLSYEKGKSVQTHYPNDYILSGDTIVFFNDEYFAKPIDRTQAYEFLKKLSGKTHVVITSMTLFTPQGYEQDFAKTFVTFNDLSNENIDQYLNMNIWADKAAGYSAEIPILIKSIDGDYFNVLGFPINAVNRLLTNQGMSLWHFL